MLDMLRGAAEVDALLSARRMRYGSRQPKD
jgi:hypothetical protein